MIRGAIVASCLSAMSIAAYQGTKSPAGVDRIAYASSQPANWDIYLFSKAGAAPRRLTTHPGLDYDPVVAPDGRWLVFCSERRGTPDLYALDLTAGGEPRLLIESEALEDQAAFSPDGKFIVFVSTYSGNADIYRLPFQPNRTVTMRDAENLTNNAAGDFRPAISPDGRLMAFSSDRDLPITARGPISRFRSGDIWTLDLDHRTLNRLTHVDGTGWNGSPKWSPDGKQIVFYSSQYGSAPATEESSIRIMDADGSNGRAVTRPEMAALSPEFVSPGRVVYSRRNARGVAEIVSVDLNGSGARVESDGTGISYWGPTRGPSAETLIAYGEGPLPPEPVGGYHRTGADSTIAQGPLLPAGAPFRRKLPDREVDLYPFRLFSVFLSPRDNQIIHLTPSTVPGPVPVWLASIDGSVQRKIAELESTTFSVMSWSKDGQWLAFTKATPGRALIQADREADVWKMRLDGSRAQNLTPNTPGFDGLPSFSGDGRRIAFASGRHGTLDVYVMNADGTGPLRLTDGGSTNIFPVFSPTANQIAFVSNRGNSPDIFDVYVLDVSQDGTAGKLRRVTRDEGQHGHLQFSYDGKWLIFASERGGISDEQPLAPAQQMYGELYAYRISDELMIRLTDNKWEEGVPTWEAPIRVR